MSSGPLKQPSNDSTPRWTAVNSAGYPAPAALAVDIAMLTVRERQLLVLTIKRDELTVALPGGLVGPAESPAQTVIRKLAEKTGLHDIPIEQLATFADPDRDPRGWIPTIAHVALVPPDTETTDPDAEWTPVDTKTPFAFDHHQILDTALDRIRGKLWWSNVAVGIIRGEFTIADAREVYETIAETTYDPATFSRDLKATGLISPTGNQRAQTGGRPAALYAFTDQHPAWGAGRRKRVKPV
jgi:8-oxo-dGTP diphosphatase